MLTLSRLLVIVALMFGLQAAALAQASAPGFAVAIGPVRLQVPVPPGFTEATALAPKLRERGESLTPATNRLLAFFVTDADLQAIAGGASPPLTRYFMVQTLRATERDVISALGMDEVKTLLRAQYRSLLAQAQPAVQSQLDAAARQIGADVGRPELSLKVGEVRGLEIFDERRNSISFAMATRVTIETAAALREVPLVIGTTTVTVGGKLLFFYACSVYDGPDDLAWVRTATTDWLTTLP